MRADGPTIDKEQLSIPTEGNVAEGRLGEQVRTGREAGRADGG
jgi:hypothetical protein